MFDEFQLLINNCLRKISKKSIIEHHNNSISGLLFDTFLFNVFKTYNIMLPQLDTISIITLCDTSTLIMISNGNMEVDTLPGTRVTFYH